ncbi:unnamed protein product [Prorocentrum cordatum]|uniref:Tudor domain-containing protein n=1 Tax=Prorocentrum cordatum TaxID=2364126 RepID=A0ABN9UIP8_9DINO|nr:unnamed protein product [Polarella glacialis]
MREPRGEAPQPQGAASGPGATGTVDPGDVPAVVEVYSNSARAWFVALVLNDTDGVLTLRFIDGEGVRQEKRAYCEDPRVALLGTHMQGFLPPGIIALPSSTRPGQLSYLDPGAQQKYGAPALAWQAWLERHLLDGSAAAADAVAGGFGTPVRPAPRPQPASPLGSESGGSRGARPQCVPPLPWAAEAEDAAAAPARREAATGPSSPPIPRSWKRHEVPGGPPLEADSRELQTSFVYRLPGDEEPLLRVVVEGVPTAIGDEGGSQTASTFAFELDPASGDGLGTTAYEELAGTSYLYEASAPAPPSAE